MPRLESLVFLWLRRVYRGSGKASPSRMFPTVEIGGSLARNALFVIPPVSFRVSGFLVASQCLWGKLQNLSIWVVSNCGNRRKSRTKCSFWCSHLSRLQSLVFWWLRRVYGGSCKTCPSWLFPSVKIGESLARNDCFGAPTCLVSSLWFSCGCAVSMGEAAKPFLFGGFQAGCHVVLRGRRVTL